MPAVCWSPVWRPRCMLKNYASPWRRPCRPGGALLHHGSQAGGDGPDAQHGGGQWPSTRAYLRNGLMLQLRRLKLGDDVQQAHMRNRQMVSKWVLERAAGQVWSSWRSAMARPTCASTTTTSCANLRRAAPRGAAHQEPGRLRGGQGPDRDLRGEGGPGAACRGAASAART
jgi:hypothetical protein